MKFLSDDFTDDNDNPKQNRTICVEKGCLHQRRIFDSGAERSHSILKVYNYIIHLHHKSFSYLLVLQSSIMNLTKKKFV